MMSDNVIEFPKNKNVENPESIIKRIKILDDQVNYHLDEIAKLTTKTRMILLIDGEYGACDDSPVVMFRGHIDAGEAGNLLAWGIYKAFSLIEKSDN